MKILKDKLYRCHVNIQSGFTLLETLIVLAIVAILLMLTTPSFYAYSAQAESKAVIQKFAGLLRMARNNAINHQRLTLLCPSKNGLTCSDDWQEGVLIFEDSNSDKQVNNQEAVVYFQSSFITKGTIHWTALHKHISFSGQGLSGSTAGSLVYCPDQQNPNYANALIVSFSGKIRRANDSNQDGILESGNNKNIVCI